MIAAVINITVLAVPDTAFLPVIILLVELQLPEPDKASVAREHIAAPAFNPVVRPVIMVQALA